MLILCMMVVSPTLIDPLYLYKSTRFTEAMIRPKSMHSKAYYEVSLFVGDIELLAVGGLHGHEAKPNKTPFLGSSIQNLPVALQNGRHSCSIYRLLCSPLGGQTP